MEYVPMANAHATQHTDSGNNKTDWSIQENITDRELAVLPSRLREDEVFSILKIIRQYELEAFNIGIEFGKEQHSQSYKAQFTQLSENLRLARHENERLAEALELITNNK